MLHPIETYSREYQVLDQLPYNQQVSSLYFSCTVGIYWALTSILGNVDEIVLFSITLYLGGLLGVPSSVLVKYSHRTP